MIRAGENLSVMLAGAQLGITVCSIALSRVGEPAVAHLLEKPFDLFGVPDAVLHTVSFVVAITIVVILHVLLGEMVPKNIALAGPEKAAMLLVPPYLAWVRATRPVIAFYDWCAHVTLRLVGVQAKTALENTVSMVELTEMIAESGSRGFARPRGAPPGSPVRCRSATASSPTSRCRCIDVRTVPPPPRRGPDGRRRRTGAGGPATPASR